MFFYTGVITHLALILRSMLIRAFIENDEKCILEVRIVMERKFYTFHINYLEHAPIL